MQPVSLKRAAAAAALAVALSYPAPARPETSVVFSLTRTPPQSRLLETAGTRALSGSLPFGPEDETPGESGSTRKWGRSQLEFWTTMTVSTVNYWLGYHRFAEDWDFGFSWADQSRRFLSLDGWRLDSNAFRLNWTHAFAGAIYYQFGRTNGFSWLESFLLFSVGGSLWWEYVSEWREAMSVGDMFFTSFGGYACGEPWVHMAERLAARPGPVPRALSFLNPILKLNRRLDGDAAAPPRTGGEFEFRLETGVRSLPDATGVRQGHLSGGFWARSIDVPGADGTAPASGMLKDTFFCEMTYAAATRGGRWEELEFTTRVSGWGWHRRTGGGAGRESRVFVGLGSAFSYFQKRPVAAYDTPAVKVRREPALDLSEPRRFRDKVSAVHLAGPLLGWTIRTPEWRLDILADAYLDFAMVNALPLNAYSETNDISGLKTTVLHYGYYSGFGTALSAAAELRWKGWRLEARARRQACGSIEGLDRFQAEIMNDVHLSDTWTRWGLRLAWRLPGSALEGTAGWDFIRRWGRIGSFTESRGESRFGVGLGFYL